MGVPIGPNGIPLGPSLSVFLSQPVGVRPFGGFPVAVAREGRAGLRAVSQLSRRDGGGSARCPTTTYWSSLRRSRTLERARLIARPQAAADTCSNATGAASSAIAAAVTATAAAAVAAQLHPPLSPPLSHPPSQPPTPALSTRAAT